MSDYDYEFDSDASINDAHRHRLSESSDSELEPRGQRSRREPDEGGWNDRRDEDDEFEDRQVDGGQDDAQEHSVPSMQMCSRHPPGAMVECCVTCEKALNMLKPEHAKQMLAPAVQSVLSRYSGRSDDKVHSMEFSDATLELAVRTLTQGKYKGGKKHFSEMVDKYISVPAKQHERLTQDLQVGPLFKKLENERRFRYIFDIRRRLGECHKGYWLCQRSIF